MSFQELLQDLTNYPRDNVSLQVVNFNPPGAVFNRGETATFRIRIRNNGPLDMNGVSLHINRQNGTQLSQSDIFGNPINFSNNLTTAAMNIGPNSSVTTRTFYVKAGNESTAGEVPLFELHIAEWDARMESMLRSAARHSSASSIRFEQRIFPS